MTAYLLVESGVRQLYGLYADALWRKDNDAFGACFAEDAVWKIAGRTIQGRTDIVAMFEAAIASAHKVAMFTGIPIVTLDGDKTTGRTQVTEYSKLKDGKAIRTLGVYYDRFVETDGRWRFQWHHFDMSYYGPPDFSEPYYDCPDYGPPPGFPGPDAPTTVRR